MRGSVTIAKVAGVPIRVHWSFALLIVFVFSSSRGMTSSYIVDYVLFLVALFVSVTLHELSHSLVAMRLGLKVRDIVLLPIGGVSEIEGMGTSRSIEGRVAIAGPLASIVLGGALLGLAAITHETLWPPSLAVTGTDWLMRLGWLNLALAAFNLLPALPMDGGRVFRSLLSRWTNDVRATRIAAIVAGVFALGMIGVALQINDFFLILIGLFVLMGANSEWQTAKLKTSLGALRVGGVMHADATTVPAQVSAAEVAAWLAHFPGRAIAVVDGVGRYAGIVDGSDVAGALPDMTVGQAADRQAPTLSPDTQLFPDAVEAFQTSRRQNLAVLVDGRVIGIVYLAIATDALMRARNGVAPAPGTGPGGGPGGTGVGVGSGVGGVGGVGGMGSGGGIG
jgi:Zn-dependent protease